MRYDIYRLFFNTEDNSNNWLKNTAVLCSVYLTPGGARMLKEVATWLFVDNPCDDAADFTSRACDKLEDAPVTLASDAGLGRASGSSASPRGPSEDRMEARSSLMH